MDTEVQTDELLPGFVSVLIRLTSCDSGLLTADSEEDWSQIGLILMMLSKER